MLFIQYLTIFSTDIVEHTTGMNHLKIVEDLVTKGSVSNEIYKAVCVVLTGELTFGVILGKLKQE